MMLDVNEMPWTYKVFTYRPVSLCDCGVLCVMACSVTGLFSIPCKLFLVHQELSLVLNEMQNLWT